MVADTRLSRVRGNALVGTVDDARKLWGVADCALAGFSGAFMVAEPAIIATHFNLMDRPHRSWKMALGMIENFLRYYQKVESQKYQAGRTVVLIGAKTGANSYRLFRLDSKTNYKRQEPGEIIADGTGKKEFFNRWPNEIDHFTRQWEQQLSGYRFEQNPGGVKVVPSPPDEKFEVDMVTCSMPIVAVSDNIVASGALPTVGGNVQAISFTKDGFSPIHAHVRSSATGRWRMATLNNIRSYSEIGRKKHLIPSIDDEGRIKT